MSFILWNMSSVQTITCIVKCFVVFKFFLTNVMKILISRGQSSYSLCYILLYLIFFSILKDQLIIRFAWKSDFIKYKHIHVKKLIIYIWDVTMHLFCIFSVNCKDCKSVSDTNQCSNKTVCKTEQVRFILVLV